ncbi:magnesium transporter MgtE N-terminal domain-containing protein, partial [Arhodomonas sp. KWT]
MSAETAAELEDWTSEIARALEAGDTEAVTGLAAARHPAEIADILEALPKEDRLAVWQAIPAPTVRGEVLIEARREVRDRLIDATRPAELARDVEHLQLDELADLY